MRTNWQTEGLIYLFLGRRLIVLVCEFGEKKIGGFMMRRCKLQVASFVALVALAGCVETTWVGGSNFDVDSYECKQEALISVAASTPPPPLTEGGFAAGLPLISGPVSMREPGRFQGKAIWPSAARSSVVPAACSRVMSAA